jgi:hypothetical protein
VQQPIVAARLDVVVLQEIIDDFWPDPIAEAAVGRFDARSGEEMGRAVPCAARPQIGALTDLKGLIASRTDRLSTCLSKTSTA